jgi:hypothetical protein
METLHYNLVCFKYRRAHLALRYPTKASKMRHTYFGSSRKLTCSHIPAAACLNYMYSFSKAPPHVLSRTRISLLPSITPETT